MGLDRKTVRWFRPVGYLTLVCLCVFLVQSPHAFGQVDEGAITGTVQDQTGAVVPDAQVTLREHDQGITLETKSNSSGGYTFSPVRIGHYSITVDCEGLRQDDPDRTSP